MVVVQEDEGTSFQEVRTMGPKLGRSLFSREGLTAQQGQGEVDGPQRGSLGWGDHEATGVSIGCKLLSCLQAEGVERVS